MTGYFGKNVLRLAMKNKGAIFGAMLIIGIGIFVMVSMLDTLQNLRGQIEQYYRDAGLADVFAEVEGIPETELSRLTEIPGIRAADGKTAGEVRILFEGQETVVSVHLMSYDKEQQLNLITLENADAFTKAAGPDVTDRPIITIRTDHANRPAESVRPDQEPVRGGNQTLGTDDIWLGGRMSGYYDFTPGTPVRLLIGDKSVEFTYRGICSGPDYIYSIPPGGAMVPDGEVYDIAVISRERMQQLLGKGDTINELGFRLSDGYAAEDVRHELSERLQPYGLHSLYAKKDQPSVNMVDGEMVELISTGTILPVIFMAVSIFMLFVVLQKMIDRDQTLIGTMKAMGMTDRELLGAYLLEGLLIGAAGALTGSVLACPFGRFMFDMYVDFFSLPDPVYHDYAGTRALGLLIALLTAVTAVFAGVRQILHITPAMAMRQKEPAIGKGWTIPAPIAKRLSVQGRMALRSMGRHPFRGFLIVLAVVFPFSLTASLLGFMPMFNQVLEYQFEDIQAYDLLLSLDRGASPARAEDAAAILGNDIESEAIFQNPVTLRHESLTDYAVLTGLHDGSRLYRILDNTGQYHTPPKGELILNRRTADKLHIKAGDLVEMSAPGLTHGFIRIRVREVISEIIGSNCYIELDSFPDAFAVQPVSNTLLLGVPEGRILEIKEKLMTTSRISWIVDTAKIVGAYRDMIDSMIFMIYMFAVLAVAAGGILIYQISMINLKERFTELGTLQVLGMRHRELSRMLLLEMSVYFALGVVLGFPGSYGINRLLEILMISDTFDIRLHVRPGTYLLTFVICLLMTLTAWYAEQRLIRRLPLTEILKARE